MLNKETAKKEVEKLVKKYELLLQEGRVRQYQEANTRKDFILPLFAAFGWEITNIEEVDEETRVSGGRVDYSFKLSGVARFYLEAKALKIDLDKQEYAQQAIDYAYNKGVPWAVLTDFEKIKVFNAEWKAKTLNDSQFFELAYNEFLDKFDQLWLLSKEAISQGLLDKEAERWGKKDKKQPISKQILADLLKAREKLTKNILQHSRLNKISEEELDESVQRILDRLIFIRTCEDRNIEQNCLSSAKRLWCESRRDLSPALQRIFRDFDNGYNSKLFEKHLCENLTIDDEILAEIIQDLYQTPDGSRYDFSAISADVLGNIYEQYLGHILKKTPKSARLKETYQHRKEMGIYYTPTYIVDYIVKNTLGEILKKTKPKDVNKIKVLDPACGSGSFLIRAFDEFINYWQKNSPGEFGYFRKIEILKNNLYGVDLDKQAVEITQMNLLLKTLYRRVKLPMLENIKQGNSLISGTEEELKKYFAENWQSKHSFNWEEEFPKVFKDGGFDVVIGNPPWVSLKGKFRADQYQSEDIAYLTEVYKGDTYRPNIYEYFIKRAISLLKPGGFHSFIVPDRMASNLQFQELRQQILETCKVHSLVFRAPFPGIIADTVIYVVEKGKPPKNWKIKVFEWGKSPISIPQAFYYKTADRAFFLLGDSTSADLVEKIERMGNTPLPSFLESNVGFIAKPDKVTKNSTSKEDICVLKGENVSRYSLKGNFYFHFTKSNLAGGTQDIGKLGVKEKILLRKTGNKIFATLDHSGNFPEQSLYFLYFQEKKGYDLKYFLGLLNSQLLNFYYINMLVTNRDATPQLKKVHLDRFPIRKIDFSNPAEKKMHDDLVSLVDRMLELNKQLQKFGDKLTDERRKIEAAIQKTDKEIDELVYKLYDLTEEEIKIVEGEE